MNRRRFLANLGAMAAATATAATGSKPVSISVDSSRPLNVIPPDFLGLGYEISSVSVSGLLSAQNQQYVQLVRQLGTSGVIRIGGNTSDDASYSPAGPSVSAPREPRTTDSPDGYLDACGSSPVSGPRPAACAATKGTVIAEADLKQLATFLDATGWKLIWGLNLGSNTPERVVTEAEAVAAAVKEKLYAFEIGNEPDLFGRGTAHRANTYAFTDYLREYRAYKAAVRAKLPNASFAGPDVAVATDWVAQFAAAEGSDLELLTHHYYRQCKGATATLDKLLYPDPKLVPELAKLRAVSASSKLPYRICETNSFCGGGQPGVSDTFGAALWVFDFLFLLASYGCAGVNIETGVNQLGFVSSYSPIMNDAAKPVYYGMLAFA